MFWPRDVIYQLIPLSPLQRSPIPLLADKEVLPIAALPPLYSDVGVQTNLAHQITQAQMEEMIQLMVQEQVGVNALTRLSQQVRGVELSLEEIGSSLVVLARGQELFFGGTLNLTWGIQKAFLPTVLKGNTISKDNKLCLTDIEKEGGGGVDNETSSLERFLNNN